MTTGVTINAQADIVDLDWKVAGDNLAFLHEETSTEWLNLDESAGYSLDNMATTLSTLDTFDGFRIATEDEVNAVMLEILGNIPNLTLQTNFVGQLRCESPFMPTVH